jgi:hypothetical protein
MVIKEATYSRWFCYRLGHSKKGWTNGEIGVGNFEHFHIQTRAKARGRYRLVLVDGHNSHYTRAFIEYGRANCILVLCYPSHTTHVYQALDVGVFSVLKLMFSQERDEFERNTGQKVAKSNFLSILGRAWVRAMTPETIKTAFRIVGVIPLDRNAIRKDALGPSRDTTMAAAMPLIPSSPVQAVSQVFRDLTRPESGQTFRVEEDNSSTHDSRLLQAVASASSHLASTSAGFLVNGSPISSSSTLPPLPFRLLQTPSPPPALGLIPETEKECVLIAALQNSHARECSQHNVTVADNARLVMQELYCERVRGQLFSAEAKKKQRNGKARLMGDGLPVLLTGDGFYERTVAHEEAEAQEAERQSKRAAEKERMSDSLAAWRANEDAKKSRNRERIALYREAVAVWEVERNRAVKECRRAPAKPKRDKLEGRIPRPVDLIKVEMMMLGDNRIEEEADANEEDDGEDEGSGAGEDGSGEE